MPSTWYGKRELWEDVTKRPYGEGSEFSFSEEDVDCVVTAVRSFQSGHVSVNGLEGYYGAAIGNVLASAQEDNLTDFNTAVNRLLELARNE